MQTASLDPPPLLRGGCVEFPVHHVRGGTSTGLVISEHWAPRGAGSARGTAAPPDGTAAGRHARRQQADHRAGADRADRQQGVLRPAGGGREPAAHRQHLRAARRRQGGDRLERELRQHDRRVAALGARYRAGGAGRHRRGVRDRHLQHQHRRDRGVAHAGRSGWRVRHGGDPRRGRRVPGRRPVPRQPGGRQDRSSAADRPGGGRGGRLRGFLRRCGGADGDRARGRLRQDGAREDRGAGGRSRLHGGAARGVGRGRPAHGAEGRRRAADDG